VRLTKLLDPTPADQRASQLEERLVNVGSPLVANLEPSKAVQPRQSPLHDPSVPPQPLARLDAAPGDARDDMPLFLSASRQRGKS